jgi:hypothetical protein
MKKDKKPTHGTSAPKFNGSVWTMSYTTEDNLPPIERLIWELRGASRALYGQRNLLFWMFAISLLAHAFR